MFYSLHANIDFDCSKAFETFQEPYYSGSQSVTKHFLRFLTTHYPESAFVTSDIAKCIRMTVSCKRSSQQDFSTFYCPCICL